MAFKMSGYSYPGQSPLNQRTTSTIDEETGKITKTRYRKSGEIKWQKEYDKDKALASKVTRYRKGGEKKKVITRGDKTGFWKGEGAKVTRYDEKGRGTTHYRATAKDIGVAAGTAASVLGGVTGGTLLIGKAAMKLGAAKPLAWAARGFVGLLGAAGATAGTKKIKQGIGWAKRGIINKIQTGKRKGIKTGAGKNINIEKPDPVGDAITPGWAKYK
tara:strand:- start:1262 stop:1909 length:648 start_codon:yes stop_codon:yes gene_type:complete